MPLCNGYHQLVEAQKEVTLYDFAQVFVGTEEVAGDADNPFIRWCHASTTMGEQADSVPWCSSFLNRLCWMLRLPRSNSALARSWLSVGVPVLGPTDQARAGYDVVVIKRGVGDQPGPENMTAPGHVGLFAGFEGGDVLILGGNQSDAVNIKRFSRGRILGIRRLA